MTPERTRPSLRLAFVIGLLITATFGIDITTGPEISASIFYLIPIGVTTWFYSRSAGLFVSALCAALWLAGEQLAGVTYSSELIHWWNMFVRLGFFIIVTQTLAARRRFELELVGARADALAATRVKSEFVSRVTHELRTPLTAIVGFAELLAKRAGPYLTADDQQCLRRIRANSETLLHLVNGVLEVGRVEAGKLTPRVQRVDVAELVEGVIADMRGRPRAAGVELLSEADCDLEPVETDPALLRQVLLNLVGNAVKFTEDGYVRVRVLTNGDRVPKGVAVEDTGIGIPPEKLESIFRPFEQADGSIHRRYGGAGLGLTIARDLCGALGHHLEVESRHGAGSKFTVCFEESPNITIS